MSCPTPIVVDGVSPSAVLLVAALSLVAGAVATVLSVWLALGAPVPSGVGPWWSPRLWLATARETWRRLRLRAGVDREGDPATVVLPRVPAGKGGYSDRSEP